MALLSVILGLGLGSISIENPGIRLELLVNEMARQSGEKLACSPAIRDEVITASFQEQPLSAVKEKLALTVCAEWTEKDGISMLAQSDEQKKQERQWHHDFRLKQISNMLDWAKPYVPKTEWTVQDATDQKKRVEETASNKEHPATAAERRSLRAREPVARLLASVMAKLTPNQFPIDETSLDTDFYLVDPSSGKGNLTADVRGELERFDREAILGADAGTSKPSTKLTIDLTWGTGSSMVEPYLNSFILDEKGNFISIANSVVFQPIGYYRPVMESFQTSQETQQRLEAVKYFAGLLPKQSDEVDEERSNRLAPLRPVLRSFYALADKQDPLGVLAGRYWIDFAKSQHKPLLANLCELLEPRSPGISVPIVSQLHEVAGMVRRDTDGWILGRPSDPFANRILRFDRRLIVRWLAISDKGEEQTLEEQLEFADLLDREDFDSLGIPYRSLVRGYLDDLFSGDVGPVMRIFAAAVKDGAVIGRDGSISVDRISSRAKRYLRQYIGDDKLYKISPLNGQEDETGTHGLLQFPNGLQGMTLRLTESQQPSFIMLNSEGKEEAVKLYWFARTFCDTLKEGKHLDVPIAKVGFHRHWDVSLSLGDRHITEEFDEPAKQYSKMLSWNAFSEAAKKAVLQEIKQFDDDNPPKF